MEIITPEFDAKTGRWFYKNKEAKSIRDLLVKLGKGFQVEDYFPDGFTGNLTRRGKLFEGDKKEQVDLTETYNKVQQADTMLSITTENKGHVAQPDLEQPPSKGQGVGSSPTVPAKPSLLETLERLGPITEEMEPIPDTEPVEEVPMIGEIKVDYSEPTQDEIDAANASCAEALETDKYVSVNGHAHMTEPETTDELTRDQTEYLNGEAEKRRQHWKNHANYSHLTQGHPMVGFFAALSSEQKQQALKYKGEENIGIPEPTPIPKPKRKHVKTGGAKGFCHPPDPNRDGILDMWAAGIVTQKIATKFGVKDVKTIARRVAYWRTQGDPRAVVRCANSIGKKRPRAKKGIV